MEREQNRTEASDQLSDRRSDEQPDVAYGRLKEGVHLAGYAVERAWRTLHELMTTGRWRECGNGFEDPSEFMRSINMEGFSIDADLRRKIAEVCAEVGASQRAIAEALGVGSSTINRDLNPSVPNGTGERDEVARNGAPPTGGVPNGTNGRREPHPNHPVPEEYRGNDVWERSVPDGRPDWRREYRGMPEYRHEDQSPFDDVKVNFASKEDRDEFAELVEQPITENTRSIWFPEAEIRRMANKEYRVPAEGKEGGPRGKVRTPPKKAADRRPPIYIVSKGRWETPYTSDYLNEYGVPHFIVVEPQEADKYRERVGPLTTVLELDLSYQERYDTFDDLGLSKSPGPGPARNYAWDHAAVEVGSDWHWVMDDNIQGFYHYNDNLKVPVGDGTVLRCMENFAARYENVLMAGPRYFMFVTRKTPGPPLTFNTRIYSCNLIRNDAPYRWRGRYNEDTDLALRMLKDGWCTILFGAFLQFKTPTQEMEGGNTDEFYAKEGTLPKSRMIKQMHPDVTKVTRRFGRPHHRVDYGPFKANWLARRPDVDPTSMPVIDNYGMRLFIEGEMQQKKEAV